MSRKVDKMNKEDLTEKLHAKIPTSYKIPNDYFQEERFQKVDINFILLSRQMERKTNHHNGDTAGKSLHNYGVQWNINKLKFSFLGKTT